LTKTAWWPVTLALSVRAGTVQMVGTALARMAAATPIVSACFDADARVLKPVICWFSCSLFARLEVPSAAAGCNGPKLGRPDWLAEVQATLWLELHRNSGCRQCDADGGHQLDDGRNGEWRPVTAPAASLGVGTRRPDSLYVNIRVRSHWTVILEPFRLVMDALRAPSSTLGEGNFTVPESKIGFDRHR